MLFIKELECIASKGSGEQAIILSESPSLWAKKTYDSEAASFDPSETLHRVSAVPWRERRSKSRETIDVVDDLTQNCRVDEVDGISSRATFMISFPVLIHREAIGIRAIQTRVIDRPQDTCED